MTNDRKNIKNDDWIEWWQAETKHRAFSASVSENIKDQVNYSEILEGNEQWEIPPSISVQRNARDIVAAIEPLLYLSKEVTLVDQYFRLTNNKTLVELFKVLAGCSVEKFTVVTSMGNANIEAAYRRDFKSLNTRQVSFIWVKAPERYFHDRYLLTDVGALRAGHGFMAEIEKGTHADMLNINIISTEEALVLLENAAKKEGKEAVSALFDRMDKCYDTELDYILRLDNELTYMPEGFNQTPEGENYRKNHFLYVSPGNRAIVKEKIKAVKDFNVKQGSKVSYRVYRSGFGTDGEYYMVAIAAKDAEHYAKRSNENREILGDERKKVMGELWSNLLKYEVMEGWIRPDLAYSSK